MAKPDSDRTSPAAPQASTRRSFVGGACAAAMAGGLAASYGTFFAYSGRFLYPARPAERGWMYVAVANDLQVGDALTYRTPAGAGVTVARQGDEGGVGDFIALSSVCPHLGCQVFWEANNDRFFCPCHNGAFDPSGKPKSGPVAEANQSLPEYELRIEDGLLMINVELESLVSVSTRQPRDERTA